MLNPPHDLLEREQALVGVDTLIARTAAGTGHTLLISGQAGLGKTSLLSEARRRAQAAGLIVLTARGRLMEREFAASVVRELFSHRLAGLPAGQRARVAEELPHATTALLDQRTRPGPDTDLFSALHGLFWLTDALATTAPCLIVADDVQWVDDLSLRFLSYLQERLNETAAGVLIASRPGEAASNTDLLDSIAAHPSTREVRLSPLGEDSARQLTRRALGELARPEVCDKVFDLTRGNPFYLGEVLRGIVGNAAGADAASIVAGLRDSSPRTIARQVLVRIGRSGIDAAHLAQAVAILGDGARLDVVAALAGLKVEQAVDAGTRLSTQDILAAANPLTFAHPLVANAVYEDIPPERRRQRHRRAADLLVSAGAVPEQVAAQLLLTDPQGDAWVCDQLVRAAASVHARGGAEGAVTYLRRALAEPPQADQLPNVLVRLGEAEAAAGLPDGPARLSAALELLTDPRRRADVALSLGRLHISAGHAQQATVVLQAGLADLPLDEDLALEIGAAYLNAATNSAATRAAAFAWANKLPSTSRGGKAARHVNAVRALRAAEQGERYESVAELCRTAWHDGALLRDSGPDGLTWRLPVWAMLLMCDPVPVWQFTCRVVEAAQQQHTHTGFVNGLTWRAYSGRMLGKLLSASADIDHVVDSVRKARWVESPAYALSAAAEIALDRGDLASSSRWIELAGDPGDVGVLGTPFLLSGRGRLRAAQGDLPGALQDHLAAGHILDEEFDAPFTAVWWRMRGALVARELGNESLASDLAARETALAEQVGSPGLVGRARYVTGAVHGLREPLESAVTLLDEAGLTLLRIDAELALGRVLRRVDDRDAAEQVLRSALQAAEQCGSTGRSSQARSQLSTLGIRPRRPATTGLKALTPTELRTAELARCGHSNRDIAVQQFVTVKAVEWHLRNAYRKLAIARRSELGAALDAQVPDATPPRPV